MMLSFMVARLRPTSGLSVPLRGCLVLLPVLALACSRDPVRPAPGDPTGIPLTAEGTIDPDSQLEWSAATGELLGSAPVGSVPSAALIAVNTSTGVGRILDSLASTAVRLSRDGGV